MSAPSRRRAVQAGSGAAESHAGEINRAARGDDPRVRAVRALVDRFRGDHRVKGLVDRFRPRWRDGLVYIGCTVCGRDLDWAQPEFVERYPAPLCALCREVVDRGQLVRPVVYPVIGEARS